jgi:hydroxymethylpyrimidine pyrophosphatase-like HAD family hydrolase
MPPRAATELARELSARGLDFMLHRAIPDNHRFYAHNSGRCNLDFERRRRLYAEYAEELRIPFTSEEPMCQAIVIDPPPGPGSLAELREALPEFQIIRTTSPFDGTSTWIEIFPIGVGKAIAASWLREQQGRRGSACVAVGNDYNDLDLLDWADLPFVVSNAPDELRCRYSTVASNDANGFTEAVRKALT